MAAREYQGLRAQGMVGDGWMPTEGDVFSRIFVCEVDPPFFLLGGSNKTTPRQRNTRIVIYSIFACLTKVVSSSQLTRQFLLACLESCCASNKSEHLNKENPTARNKTQQKNTTYPLYHPEMNLCLKRINDF